MKHALREDTAHKRARHAQKASIKISSSHDLPTLSLSELVKSEVNKMPRTRRERREYARLRARKHRLTVSGACALLFGTVGTTIVAVAAPHNDLMAKSARVSMKADMVDVAPTMQNSLNVSRSSERSGKHSDTHKNENTQDLSIKTSDTAQWSLDNQTNAIDVKNIITLGHPTGDTGLAYEFSQCTWWVYLRRHELGLPVGSHFGNARQWSYSARALGYSVDRTPQVGDVVVFQPGQAGADATYGHVAIVESVNSDGTISISECSESFHGQIRHRTIGNIHSYEYIHS